MSIQYENKMMQFFPTAKPDTRKIICKGGAASVIADGDKCPSGRHNTKLTDCWCTEHDSKTK